jgi:hypothetical protein
LRRTRKTRPIIEREKGYVYAMTRRS